MHRTRFGDDWHVCRGGLEGKECVAEGFATWWSSTCLFPISGSGKREEESAGLVHHEVRWTSARCVCAGADA